MGEPQDQIKIKTLKEMEYEYPYNITGFRMAQKVNLERIDKLDQAPLPAETKLMLKQYSKDLEILLDSLIEKKAIKSNKDFDKIYQTAVLVETNIQSFLNTITCWKRIKLEIHRKDLKEWRENLSNMGEESGWRYMFEGRSFILWGILIGIIGAALLFFLCAVLSAFIPAFTSDNGFTIIEIYLILHALLWTPITSKKMKVDQKTSDLIRIKNQYVYTRHKKITVSQKTLNKLIRNLPAISIQNDNYELTPDAVPDQVSNHIDQ